MTERGRTHDRRLSRLLISHCVFTLWHVGSHDPFSLILLHVHRTVLEVNYLFHAESSGNYLFKKTPAPPPPLEIEWWPPYYITICLYFLNNHG